MSGIQTRRAAKREELRGTMMADVGAAQCKAKNELRNQDGPCGDDNRSASRFALRESVGKHEQNRNDHQRGFKLACACRSAGVGIDGGIIIGAGGAEHDDGNNQQKQKSGNFCAARS